MSARRKRLKYSPRPSESLQRKSASAKLKPAENPADMVKELQRLRTKEMICFGHAPHLDLLIAQLVGARNAFTELKKSGVACFEHASVHGRWGLLWILTPKLLRKLAD
jgi:phosphohistidine phosphatase SixA